MHTKVLVTATAEAKARHYQEVQERIEALIMTESDWVAAMATVVCELHHSFDYFHWTGFYRTVSDNLLKIGPYQGGHGCLTIPFTKGVCGAAARTQKTQVIADVNAIKDHIACAATTMSEIVVPLIGSNGKTKAVLDIDSDIKDAFKEVDRECLQKLCHILEKKFLND